MAFDNLQLEKGMYCEAGKSFTQVLEALDPSENYRGTPLEGTDAFQRQLKRFHIRVRGKGSDPVEKFFSTASSAVLFPEYISRSVRQGMEEEDVLPAIVATTTYIDSQDYRVIQSDAEQKDVELARVAEGAEIPTVKISLSDTLTKLYKRGRMLVASYEALRFQKLDLFSVFLHNIGRGIQKSHVQDALQILTEGGSNQTAVEYQAGDSNIGGEPDELSYDQLVRLWTCLRPYQMNTIIASEKLTQKMLLLSQMQDAEAGLNFHGTGKMITPFGARLVTVSEPSLDGILVGIDHRYALEMVRAGDVAVEYDKLIDRQLERAAITSIAGFDYIYNSAAAIVTYDE